MSSRRKLRKKKRYSHGGKIKKDEHHVYPRSRRKKGDLGKFEPICRRLVLKTKIKEHAAWHHIFYNYFPEEAIALVKFAFKSQLKSPQGIISFIKQFYKCERAVVESTKEDLSAWQEIFGNTESWRKIRKIILKKWTYPGIKAKISDKGKIAGLMIFLQNIPKRTAYRIKKDIYRCKNIQVVSLKENQLLKII